MAVGRAERSHRCRIADRHAPARPQAEAQRQFFGCRPTEIRRDVRHDHRLVQKRGGAARSYLRSDGEPIYAAHVLGRRLPADASPQLAFIFVEQQHRAKTTRRHAFNASSEGIQDFFKRRAFRNQLQNVAFFWMNCVEWPCFAC